MNYLPLHHRSKNNQWWVKQRKHCQHYPHQSKPTFVCWLSPHHWSNCIRWRWNLDVVDSISACELWYFIEHGFNVMLMFHLDTQRLDPRNARWQRVPHTSWRKHLKMCVNFLHSSFFVADVVTVVVVVVGCCCYCCFCCSTVDDADGNNA